MKKFIITAVLLAAFFISGNAWADSTITALSAATVMTTDDLFLIVDDPGGTPSNKKLTLASLLDSLEG